ncbi:DUF2892 domain-containing protein [Streptomyces sp. NPDC002215]|uniref:YgaP family membrane protein n=1 Tax=Streptomyces sp. NPDC002215 TaxID=3154412 RepID=UPI0033174D1B
MTRPTARRRDRSRRGGIRHAHPSHRDAPASLAQHQHHPAERVGRVAVGLAGIIVGLVLIAGAGSVLAVVLEVLLIVAGLDLLITGALGHCPLYAKLGHMPKSLRNPR